MWNRLLASGALLFLGMLSFVGRSPAGPGEPAALRRARALAGRPERTLAAAVLVVLALRTRHPRLGVVREGARGYDGRLSQGRLS